MWVHGACEGVHASKESEREAGRGLEQERHEESKGRRRPRITARRREEARH